jgi:hypothetical protein
MQYDAGGQPLTVTLADYLLPSVDVVPVIEIHHMESPSPLNPLGVKGAARAAPSARRRRSSRPLRMHCDRSRCASASYP